jgi:hypothetical protein
MRPAVPAALALVVAACTGPVERVTEALSPSPRPSPTLRVTRTVGDAIEVQTPLENDEVGSPVSVRGTADVAGAQVVVRVLDDAGAELAQAVTDASCGDGCRGTFAVEVYFFVEERTPGWVEVSGASAEGPAPLVRIPVVLAPP